jgi:ubiquinol-cytochrome c reductase iron-sulfur subunit
MYPPVEPSPALVCPCHYSTFDVADGGNVLFGPAGRALPQLPLMIDRRGRLRAGGNFSGPVGPSWWGVRKKPAVSPGDNS